MESRVDFPQPLVPTILTNSPFFTEKLIFFKAVISPFSAWYVFSMFFTLSISKQYHPVPVKQYWQSGNRHMILIRCYKVCRGERICENRKKLGYDFILNSEKIPKILLDLLYRNMNYIIFVNDWNCLPLTLKIWNQPIYTRFSFWLKFFLHENRWYLPGWRYCTAP